jgi:hypothetical protein
LQVLENFYMKMLYEGGEINAGVFQGGSPIFTVITSAQTSRRIRQMSNAGLRDDFRYTGDSEYIMKPLGSPASYDGFVFTNDLYPPRYNLVDDGGLDWVRIQPYISVATTNGDRDIPNPAYHAAAWEDAIIFHQDVYTSLVPNVSTTIGNVKVNPQNYMGDFDFKVYVDRVDNPDGNWGLFRAKFANASKPVRPNLGFVIRHKRLISAGIEVVAP